MWNITTREPLKQIPVQISGCPHCKGTTAALHVEHVTQYVKLAGVLDLLKTHSSRADVFCDGCNKYVKKKYLSPEVQALAKEEKAKVKFTFWQRFGAWITLLAVIVILRFVFKL